MLKSMFKPEGSWTLFFDLDGTLMQGIDDADPELVAALQEVRKGGHRVVLATGRAPASIPRAFLEVSDAAITLTGALCQYEGKILFQSSLDPEIIEALGKVCESYKISFFLENERHFCAVGNESYFTGTDAEFYKTATMYLEDAQKLTEALERQEVSFTKVAISTPCYDRLCQCGWELPSQLDAFHAGDCVDIVPKGVDKGTAIRRFMKELELLAHRTICFGDSSNDLAMFQVCALAVSVGQKSQTLVDAASYVSPGVEDAGVLHALRFLGFLE